MEEEKIENFVVVKNVFRADLPIFNKDFDENHLLVYTYLQRFFTYEKGISFSLKDLFDELCIKNYRTQQKFIQYFKDLINFGLIEMINKPDKITNDTELQVQIPKYDNNFTKIRLKELIIISRLKVDLKQKKTMLFLYIDLASRIDEKGYCFPSFKQLQKDLQTTNANRISSSLKKLKQYGFIDYQNLGNIVVDGNIKQSNNIYVLCCDAGFPFLLKRGLDDLKEKLQMQKINILGNKHSNRKRSVKQQLNNLWKKFDNNSINTKERDKLYILEMEYYNFIKLSKEKLEQTQFRIIRQQPKLNLSKLDYDELYHQKLKNQKPPKEKFKSITNLFPLEEVEEDFLRYY